MISRSRKESLEKVTSSPDLGVRKPSISSLEKFKSPSPLPASQGLLFKQQTILNELARSIQTDGTKVNSMEEGSYSYVAIYAVLYRHIVT